MDKRDIQRTTSITSTPTDDEDAVTTTSTESDTFDTWTLVTDKKRLQPTASNAQKAAPSTNATDEHLKALEAAAHNDNDIEEQPQCFKTELNDASNASVVDDLSDGISIISESESAGRMSPHPLLRQHLQDLNLKFDTCTDYVDEISESSTDPAQFAVTYSAVQNIDVAESEMLRRSPQSASHILEQLSQDSVSNARIHPVVRTGLTGLFYVGVLLAVLAFWGKLRHPAWEPMASSKHLSQLEQKLTELELQNNLMRAEIDILSKQVNYLSNLKESTKPTKQFKTWPKEVKTPEPMLKCDEDICLDSIGTDLPDLQARQMHERAVKMKYFVKNEDKLNKIPQNPYVADAATADNTADKEPLQNAQTPPPKVVEEKVRKLFERKLAEQLNKDYAADSKSANVRKDAPKFQQRYEKKYEEKKHQSHEQRHNDYDDDDDDDDHNNSKQRNYPEKRHTKYTRDANSKERFNKHEPQRENYAKQRENYEKQQQKRRSSSKEFQNNDGQWHAQLMQQRESARRKSEQLRNDKNWFIERGDGREQVRNVDQRYR